MTCLDDALVLGLVEGRLAAAQLAAVDEHIDGCDSCRDVVTMVASARMPVRVLARGDTISAGRYVIGELLGGGAMGRVYSAWEPELDRRVAIKVLREQGAGSRERMVREAQAMARVVHPNVVTVHEVGATDDGVFVAMELVEGETLRAWSQKPAKDRRLDENVRVLIETARGLSAVHAAGVVHRDIKPDNVIVGADGRVRLGDFGLARRGATHEALATGSIELEVSSTAIAGTPAYMAPEVLRGNAADATSDQFSFGIMAYELLDGKRPFEGKTWSELVTAIERASVKPLRGVPGWLDEAVRRCLAIERKKRFASMTAIADHLAAHATKRRPTMWIAGALAVGVLASGATWFALHDRSAAGPSCDIALEWKFESAGDPVAVGTVKRAIGRWANSWRDERSATCKLPASPQTAARDRCLALRRDEFRQLVAAVEGVPIGQALDAITGLAPSTDCRTATAGMADPLPLDPEKQRLARAVESQLVVHRAEIAVGKFATALTALEPIVRDAKASEHQPTIAEALLVQATALRAASRLNEAARVARDAVAAAERGRADDLSARAWIQRVEIAGDRRELDNAEDAGAIAQAAVERVGAPPYMLASLVRLRGMVAYNRGALDEAKAFLDDARARFVAIHGDGPSLDIARVESGLGSVARAAGKLDEAERHHRNAHEIDRKLRGASHADIARDLHNIAGVQRLRGDLVTALATYREALAMEKATVGERGIAAGVTHNSIGLVLLEQKQLVEAKAELELARSILVDAGHGDRGFAEHNLGLVAQAAGDHAQALKHFAAAELVYATTIGSTAEGPARIAADRQRSEAVLNRPRKPANPAKPVPEPPIVKFPVGVYGSGQ